MDVVKRIGLLCEEHGTTFAAVERECGLSNGSIRRWATNTPSTDKIQKVADYFNVSLDYLQGRTDYKYIVSSNGLDTKFDLGSVKLNKIARYAKDLAESDQDTVLNVVEALRRAKRENDRNDNSEDI